MGASATVSRRVQWIDTDAAGIWHYSTVLRWAEEAETELHRGLGVVDQTFGVTPRVRVEFEFQIPLRFDDLVDVSIEVARLGDTSIDYHVEVRLVGELAASGRVVAVLVDPGTGMKRPWPDELRSALGG
jgi:acyl-CoA thioester hydrolase